MRAVTICLLATLAVVAVAGCHSTTTYGGSENFDEKHPDYQHRPDYMDPTIPSDDPDTGARHPW